MSSRGRRPSDNELVRTLMYPSFWVVQGIDYDDDDWSGSVVEGAFAFDPRFVKSRTHPSDAVNVVEQCGLYAKKHPDQKVVLFSDVTRWLSRLGTSWEELRIDWMSALDFLSMKTAGLHMTVSRRAILHITNASESHTVLYDNGASEVLTEQERDAVRRALADKLAVDWPRYINDMVQKGHLTFD